jgi:hypothetical protein
MKAIVKDIPEGTVVNDENHYDTFEMWDLIGKEIKIIRRRNTKNWFYSEKNDVGKTWNFHKSWLEIIKEKK